MKKKGFPGKLILGKRKERSLGNRIFLKIFSDIQFPEKPIFISGGHSAIADHAMDDKMSVGGGGGGKMSVMSRTFVRT